MPNAGKNPGGSRSLRDGRDLLLGPRGRFQVPQALLLERFTTDEWQQTQLHGGDRVGFSRRGVSDFFSLSVLERGHSQASLEGFPRTTADTRRSC